MSEAAVVPAVYTAPTVLWTPAWDGLRHRLEAYSPRTERGRIVKEAFRYLPPELAGEMLDSVLRTVVLESQLSVTVYRGPRTAHGRPGDVERKGVVSRKVITDAGVAFLVDAWGGSTEMENLRYHGLGTGTNAEAAGNTALQTELTTQYATDNTRPTGTLAESAANIFQTVGTNTLDTGATIQEHGIFSQAATGGGVLWDRSLTGAQTLSASDSLQSTYSMTATSGG
jgi:hypothetical protein